MQTNQFFISVNVHTIINQSYTAVLAPLCTPNADHQIHEYNSSLHILASLIYTSSNRLQSQTTYQKIDFVWEFKITSSQYQEVNILREKPSEKD